MSSVDWDDVTPLGIVLLMAATICIGSWLAVYHSLEKKKIMTEAGYEEVMLPGHNTPVWIPADR